MYCYKLSIKQYQDTIQEPQADVQKTDCFY